MMNRVLLWESIFRKLRTLQSGIEVEVAVHWGVGSLKGSKRGGVAIIGGLENVYSEYL